MNFKNKPSTSTQSIRVADELGVDSCNVNINGNVDFIYFDKANVASAAFTAGLYGALGIVTAKVCVHAYKELGSMVCKAAFGRGRKTAETETYTDYREAE